MPLPNQCIECGKEFNPEIDLKYSQVTCKKCVESYFEPTTADKFNTPAGIGFHHKEIKKNTTVEEYYTPILKKKEKDK